MQARMARRDIEKVYSRSEFAAKLRRLADAIEGERPFTIQVAGERMRIPRTAEFNIEHERTGVRQEIEFQLIWERRPASRR
jgi:amphi-Trp domain-containing protein